MGWKNVRDHYRIKHIVHVRDGVLCVGSGFVTNIIEIRNAFPVFSTSVGRGNADLDRYMAEMQADRAKLRELIETPDTFERSITVWTCDYFKGLIIEKQCEEFGWPNVTHDGELMYENSFSTDRAEIVEYARRNAAAGVESAERNIADAEQKLAERREIRDKYAAALAKFNDETQKATA